MEMIEERLNQLEIRVDELESKEAIRALLSDYAVAVDGKDRVLLAEVFAEGARINIPEWSVDVSGKQGVLEFYDDYWARFDSPRRYFANESFEIDSGNAKVFMYWHVTQESGGESWLGWGTYEWSFIKEGQHWKIAGVIIDILAMTTLKKGWAGSEKIF